MRRRDFLKGYASGRPHAAVPVRCAITWVGTRGQFRLWKLHCAQLRAIASWPHASWIEILHDPPVAAYTHGFAMMENPPMVDEEKAILICRKARVWG